MRAFECLPLDKVKDKWEQCAGTTSTVPYFPIEIELCYYYVEPSLSKVPYERMLGCVTTRGGEKRTNYEDLNHFRVAQSSISKQV